VTLETALLTYGYGALFVGTLVEGETFLLAAAVLASLGHLDWAAVLAVAFAGAYTGDQIFFHLGRSGRGLPLRPGPGWRRRLEWARRLLSAHRLKFILGYRFLYGLRAVIPFAIGASGCPAGRFMALSAAGTLAWVLVSAAAGRLLGACFDGGSVAGPRLVATAAGGLLVFGVWRWRRQVRDR